MSDTPVMKKAKILRDFTDAGTARQFTAGQTPEPSFTAGEFENYRAAGLVEEVVDVVDAAPIVAAPAEGDAAKPGRNRA